MICLTFDTDHLNSEDMSLFFSRYKWPGEATFFLWRPMLGVEWGNHEIEPHPFFRDGCAIQETLDKLVQQINIIPKGLRSHSCLFSHAVGLYLNNRGYSYSSNHALLFKEKPLPYRHPWGIWELPIYYMDNMDFTMSKNWPDLLHEPFSDIVIERALTDNGIYVFDFHPLHVIMNTSSLDDYEKVKQSILNSSKSPFDIKFFGNGTEVFFDKLVAKMREHSLKSHTCLDALGVFCNSKKYR